MVVIAVFIAFFSLNHVSGTRFITDDFAIFSLENVLFLNYHFFYYIEVCRNGDLQNIVPTFPL